jgi:hypothetical protein
MYLVLGYRSGIGTIDPNTFTTLTGDPVTLGGFEVDGTAPIAFEGSAELGGFEVDGTAPIAFEGSAELGGFEIAG